MVSKLGKKTNICNIAQSVHPRATCPSNGTICSKQGVSEDTKPLHISPINRACSVSVISPCCSFLRKNFGIHMRSWAGPVTEISVFATENLVTGIKIFPYEHSNYTNCLYQLNYKSPQSYDSREWYRLAFRHFGAVSRISSRSDRAEILHVNKELNSSQKPNQPGYHAHTKRL